MTEPNETKKIAKFVWSASAQGSGWGGADFFLTHFESPRVFPQAMKRSGEPQGG